MQEIASLSPFEDAYSWNRTMLMVEHIFLLEKKSIPAHTYSM